MNQVKIENVIDYIEKVGNYIDFMKQNFPDFQIVFRGQANSELEIIPSLFRYNHGYQFEYNQIHFLKSSKFVEEEVELEIAIRAQHYGYATRLLDVTYNALVALFFACYDFKEETKNKDGKVSVIAIDSYLPPTSVELSNIYYRLIKNADIFNSMVIDRDPLIVENIKNNDRIIAQHGAFLLFFNKDQRLDKKGVFDIVIDSGSKQLILTEMEQLFRINLGSLFPDIQSNSSEFNINGDKKYYSGEKNLDICDIIIDTNMKEYIKKIVKSLITYKEKYNDDEYQLELKRHLRVIKEFVNNNYREYHDFFRKEKLEYFKNYLNEKVG